VPQDALGALQLFLHRLARRGREAFGAKKVRRSKNNNEAMAGARCVFGLQQLNRERERTRAHARESERGVVYAHLAEHAGQKRPLHGVCGPPVGSKRALDGALVRGPLVHRVVEPGAVHKHLR